MSGEWMKTECDGGWALLSPDATGENHWWGIVDTEELANTIIADHQLAELAREERAAYPSGHSGSINKDDWLARYDAIIAREGE